MALQISNETNMGVAATECYAKIERIIITHTGTLIIVEFFYNQSARQNDKKPLDIKNYECSTNIPVSNTLIGSCYTYLKTLPEFADALDV